ncbi:MAG: response regulator [Actinomycetota bacterium]|nr:response regulator [Actinomycetota bacterium]
MRIPPRILIAEDNVDALIFLEDRLAGTYEILAATDGEQALAVARERRPDLILLDIMMPKLDGIQVCRALRGDPALPFIPIILVTAKADSKDVVAGLEAGADEYLTKPVDPDALVARVKSMLRIKALHDELDELNRSLDARVKQQVDELERMSRLRRYLSPQLAELIVSAGDDKVLASHRRPITVVFCDLRGYTDFADAAEPEDVIQVLRDYHRELGKLIDHYEGTLERFAGDGLMVFFNDPIECPNPQERAVTMAVEMRERMRQLTQLWWEKLGGSRKLGFGVGIDHGYATLGRIGFEGRFDYAAIGSVTNRSARLCATAQDEQILITQRV